MLLSSVAESMLWTGRYLERARALARAVFAHERLSLDLPAPSPAGLRPLLRLVGREVPRDPTADPVVTLHALVLDGANSSSVAGALCRARENLRRARVVVPYDVWVTLNALHFRLSEIDAAHVAGVLGALEEVVAAGNRIEGEITASMTRDAAYSFLRIGWHLERADMLLRTVDVLLSILEPSGPQHLFEDVRWMGLLQAVSAHSMYRRRHHTRVDLPTVLAFLTADPSFPRSVAYCLAAIDHELDELPHSLEARSRRAECERLAAALPSASASAFSVNVSGVLDALEACHEAVQAAYFPRAASPTASLGDERSAPEANGGESAVGIEVSV